eukprot:3590598-Lingulodinium_polyedra.AAC.1
MVARASESFLVGHAVEVAALEQHHFAPWARVAEMHAWRELHDPVRGRGKDVLLEALENGPRTE